MSIETISSVANHHHFSLDKKDNTFSFDTEGPLTNELSSVEWYLAYASAWLLEQGYVLSPESYEHITTYDRYGIDCTSDAYFKVWKLN